MQLSLAFDSGTFDMHTLCLKHFARKSIRLQNCKRVNSCPLGSHHLVSGKEKYLLTKQGKL